MSQNTNFRVGVIRPVECFQEGWELIKDRYWLFLGISVVGVLLGGLVPFGLLLGAMFCGIYYCLFKQMNRQPIEFGELFKGFDFFLPSLIVTLFIAVPGLVFGVGVNLVMIPMQFAIQSAIKRGDDPMKVMIPFFATFAVVALVFGLLLACVHALIMFAYPLIVERKLNGIEAFKLSARAVLANLGGVVGLILIEFLLGIIGVLLCYVGVFLVIPLNFAAVIVAHRKVFPPIDAPFTSPPPPPDFNQPQSSAFVNPS